ncbi:siderophore-iron reductase FhuF [Paracidovorax valerianellae]|uniref:Ferric iron reductase protein FhuF n=1 Tax=Paracidovorax valerianellae TaxID=187868 RepID=A0A1G7EAS3_9BURK|nr:siderophore-iron reductase FhuF [Paracidovorax valerianellae]MDA8447408.1 siderophore-iron reductase FhuF [Paracidovorax valerianellae]SDE60794.1 ferric iron reductase protein FhuF [Paracidovorax valerianellae]
MPIVIPLLQPLFPGALAEHGTGLQCAPVPPHDALNLAALLDDADRLSDLLHCQAQHRGAGAGTGSGNLRAVASVWTLHYLDRLLPPVVAGASVLQQPFPIAAQDVWVRLDRHGTVLDFHLCTLGSPMHGASTAERYADLLWQHLGPLFERLTELTRVAPKILWGNAARRLEPILEQAMVLAGSATPAAADRDFLLHRPHWPQPGGLPLINPLFGPQRQVPRSAATAPLTLHRQCCLYYLLPGESHCGACPLAPQHRRAAEAPQV